MAKCTYKLPEDLMKKLSKAESNIDEIVSHALNEGGNIVLNKVKENLNNVLSHTSTGELEKSIGLSGVLIDRKGNPNVKIGFSEPRSDGESNAKIATILEYGSSHQKARPFLKPAKRKSKKECIAKMKEVIESELDKLWF